MSRLIESIKVSDNQVFRLEYHKRRMANSFHAVYGSEFSNDLSSIINDVSKISPGTFKLRIIYDRNSLSHEFIPYIKPTIQKLRIVESDSISYPYKFSDRTGLNQLYEQKQGADDILISKNNILTDTLYCNVALLKNEKWYTPLTPLLHGTQRAALLDKNKIIPRTIKISELRQYTKICLFNAMLEFQEIILNVDDIQE